MIFILIVVLYCEFIQQLINALVIGELNDSINQTYQCSSALPHWWCLSSSKAMLRDSLTLMWHHFVQCLLETLQLSYRMPVNAKYITGKIKQILYYWSHCWHKQGYVIHTEIIKQLLLKTITPNDHKDVVFAKNILGKILPLHLLLAQTGPSYTHVWPLLS